MSKRRTTNKRLTSDRDQQKKFIIRGVVKRGSNPQLKAAGKNAWKVIKTLFKVAALVAVFYGGWVAYDRLFWRNPDYAFSEFGFSTDGPLTREQALTTTNLKPGRNIYDYDLTRAADALRAMPQVENVEIRRYLPNRIEVAVTERKPVAWVTNAPNDERTHLLDARGLVFKPKRILPEYEPLPIISGVELGDLAPGKPIRKSELVAALELLRLSRENVKTQILSIDVSKGYCMVATDQRHAKITFGLDDIAEQLERLTMYRNAAETAIPPIEIEAANLMVKYNVPITPVKLPEEEMEEPEPAPEPPPVEKSKSGSSSKSSKPSPAKKAEPVRPKVLPKGDPVLKSFRKTA